MDGRGSAVEQFALCLFTDSGLTHVTQRHTRGIRCILIRGSEQSTVRVRGGSGLHRCSPRRGFVGDSSAAHFWKSGVIIHLFCDRVSKSLDVFLEQWSALLHQCDAC